MTFLFWFCIALAAILLLWLLATRPRLTRRGMREMAEGQKYFAHRGLHGGEIPENSLPAFRAAAEAGYGIELDVQLTADGVPVVFHDESLRRMLGVDGGVYDLTLEELQALPLGGREGICVPTFAEVLELVGGRVPLIVEIKAQLPEWPKTLAGAMALLDLYRGPFCVESFNPLVLRWLRRHRPAVLRGQLCERYRLTQPRRSAAMVLCEWFLLHFLGRPDFVAYNGRHKDTAPFWLLTHFFPECVYAVWTPRSPEDEQAFGPLFDVVIFEGYRPPAGGADAVPDETAQAPAPEADVPAPQAEETAPAAPEQAESAAGQKSREADGPAPDGPERKTVQPASDTPEAL